MTSPDPLGVQAQAHAQLRQLGETLRGLAEAGAPARDGLPALAAAFDTALRRHRDHQEQDLFPALLESMAGSDPVCLREMTTALGDEHRALDLHWRQLRAGLAQVVGGPPGSWPRGEPEGFVAQLDRHLRREDAELLPMAARLLGDAELERLGRALRERDARE